MTITKTIHCFFSILEKKHRLSFFLLTFFVFISSIFEAFSIILIIPLAEAALGFEELSGIGLKLKNLLNHLGLSSDRETIIYFSIALFLTVATLRLVTLKLNIALGFYITRHLSMLAFQGAVTKGPQSKYTFAQVSSVVSQKVNSISNQLVLSLIYTVSSLISVGLLISVTIVFAPGMFINLFLFLSASYLVVSMLTKTKLEALGGNIKDSLTNINALIIAAFANRNFLNINDTTSKYIAQFEELDQKQKEKLSTLRFITDSPKILIELLLILGILISFLIFPSGSLIENLPALGVALFATAKILPHLQLIFRSVALMSSIGPIFEEFLLLITNKNKLSILDNRNKSSKQRFQKIEVCYELKNRNDNSNKFFIEINKGDNLCLFGESGCGKTTFLNAFTGISENANLELILDGKSVKPYQNRKWQNLISYLEQSCWLIPGSVEDNILFGNHKHKYHEKKINEVIQMSGLKEFSQTIDISDKTAIGDNNTGVSGGEARRIFLARVLYGLKEILVIDEPTTGLDSETSDFVFRALMSLKRNITIICVTHDQEKFPIFDKIYNLTEFKNSK